MREEQIHKIETHIAGICINADGKILIAKRNAERKIYPNMWECGGGQVHAGECFEDAVKRQLKEELGVIIEPEKVLGIYKIQVPDEEQKVIPGVKFKCKITGFENGNEPTACSEFSEWKFIGKEELDNYEFIPGIKEDLLGL
ncbi:MAG: NUDIX domain-containing protein [Candidatus Undinarchaeales archaeon]|nr:NUDIX domain-containing protein [Candidatus Undinarchaeales archaeon]